MKRPPAPKQAVGRDRPDGNGQAGLARLFGLFADDQVAIVGLSLGELLPITIIARNEAGDHAESAPETITLA